MQLEHLGVRRICVHRYRFTALYIRSLYIDSLLNFKVKSGTAEQFLDWGGGGEGGGTISDSILGRAQDTFSY